ncbi:ribosomal protection-like ABC-F family protein [Bacillus sp. FJAT-45037]|uniref:ribosomal protection-like ABC-F family protein n=1 Tax=Bacillus sp. FJAT-45037 TaxID=2011007 RepID=UPI000C23CFAD|nr:ABC-F family ATP-binding cassette domain-containing protein [Bacillus sp. FJAT-45037]
MINVSRVSKNYTGEPVLCDVSFTVKKEEKIAVVGPNGSGKSTLLNLIANRDTPDSGQIAVDKDNNIGVLEQIPNEQFNLSVRQVLKSSFSYLEDLSKEIKGLEDKMARESDNESLLDINLKRYGKKIEEFERLGGYSIESSINSVVEGLGINGIINNQYDTLSGGEKTKVGLGKLLLSRPEILLLDEPTNHLDVHAIEWLEDFVKSYKGTVLFISHDKTFLSNVAEKIIDIYDNEVKVWSYKYNEFLIEKEKFLLNEFNRYTEQQKKIKKMKEAIKTLREWANRSKPPSEALHRRATNMEKALNRIQKIQKPKMQNDVIKDDFEKSNRSSNTIFLIENAKKQYGDRILFENVNLYINYGEKIGIVGNNGTGKSTLIKCLLGNEKLTKGTIKSGNNLNIGYISQSLLEMESDMTVLEAFREGLVIEAGEARNILARFLFFGSNVNQKVKNLSGGERMRLRLAQLMQMPINILILDEPTNHLDIETQEIIQQCIEDFFGTVLCISHDRSLLNSLESTLWIDKGLIEKYKGPYFYAKEKKEKASSN